jgi:UDP-N-acetylglucosamine 1-carboxyvinyltransferase
MKIKVVNNAVPQGTVDVSGAKNSATRLLAAALLSDEKTIIYNFPTDLEDVKSKSRFIREMGGFVELDDERQIAIVSGKGLNDRKPNDCNVPFRTTYLLAAASLMRYGIAKIPYPGGCKIGERKYDLHIMVWEAFGAKVEEKDQWIEIKCNQLKPARISFPISTVGGTENALLCAATIAGKTSIENAYVTPEIENLIQLLRQMGAKIDLAGSSHIFVEGSNGLCGATATTIPDRIEALTWMVYAILTGGNITIKNVPFDLMEVPLLHLRYAGVDYYKNQSNAHISPECLALGSIEPFEVACGTYPGVISDMQPLFVMLGLGAKGRSRVFDYRYPKRTNYLNELSKFVPNSINWKDGEIVLDGPGNFISAFASATDLRGTMASVIAALVAGGGAEVDGVEMALRGYSRFQEKLTKLGVFAEVY